MWRVDHGEVERKKGIYTVTIHSIPVSILKEGAKDAFSYHNIHIDCEHEGSVSGKTADLIYNRHDKKLESESHRF